MTGIESRVAYHYLTPELAVPCAHIGNACQVTTAYGASTVTEYQQLSILDQMAVVGCKSIGGKVIEKLMIFAIANSDDASHTTVRHNCFCCIEQFSVWAVCAMAIELALAQRFDPVCNFGAEQVDFTTSLSMFLKQNRAPGMAGVGSYAMSEKTDIGYNPGFSICPVKVSYPEKIGDRSGSGILAFTRPDDTAQVPSC
jgi:hypothetical protein